MAENKLEIVAEPGKPTIVTRRVVAALRALVFDAFAEKDGKTTVTTLTVHKTLEGRDGHLAHGMEAGMTEGYARLDERLADLLSGSPAVAAP